MTEGRKASYTQGRHFPLPSLLSPSPPPLSVHSIHSPVKLKLSFTPSTFHHRLTLVARKICTDHVLPQTYHATHQHYPETGYPPWPSTDKANAGASCSSGLACTCPSYRRHACRAVPCNLCDPAGRPSTKFTSCAHQEINANANANAHNARKLNLNRVSFVGPRPDTLGTLEEEEGGRK